MVPSSFVRLTRRESVERGMPASLATWVCCAPASTCSTARRLQCHSNKKKASMCDTEGKSRIVQYEARRPPFMSFKIQHIDPESKFCQHLRLQLLETYYPRE